MHILADAEENVLELFRSAINVDIVNGPQVRNMEIFSEGSQGFRRGHKKFDDGFVIGRE